MDVKLKNRSGATVIYRIPEDNIRREFAPMETKNIPIEEIQKLTYQPGGQRLLAGYLQILDSKILKKLGITPEIEYFYSEVEVKKIMQSGSDAEFEDCLEFAPDGVHDIIKVLAVDLPLNSTSKKSLIRKHLNFDVDAALMHVEEDRREEENNNKDKEDSKAKRRVTPVEKTVATPRYRVVDDK